MSKKKVPEIRTRNGRFVVILEQAEYNYAKNNDFEVIYRVAYFKPNRCACMHPGTPLFHAHRTHSERTARAHRLHSALGVDAH